MTPAIPPVDEERVAGVDRLVRTDPRLRHVRGVVVVQGGRDVFVGAYGGTWPGNLCSLYSVTKSFTATVAAVAVRAGALALTTRVDDVLEVPWRPDDPRRRITLEHLLTMTAGLDVGPRWDMDGLFYQDRPWVEATLDSPLVGEPGETFGYDNGLTHVAAVMVQRALGRTVADAAAEHLFGPLGIGRHDWPADPEGHTVGSTDLRLAPRDAARLGELFLAGGVGRGRRIVDEDWVRAATRAHSAGGPPEETGYGYGWWVGPVAGRSAYFAGGWGGQYILVVPSLELVLVSAADAWQMAHDAPSIRTLLEDLVPPA